jgi:uncharacterized membrane protein
MWHKVKEYFTHEDKRLRDNRWVFASMLIGSILSLIASFVLSVDALELVKNKDVALSCDVNAVISCSTVNSHPSAHLFGFPNAFIGLMAEPVVITVAIAGLSGVKFGRRFSFAAQIGYTLGFMFAYWLLGMSYFVIGALCPWCLLVTLTTTLVWFAMTRYNIRENNLYLPRNIEVKLKKFIDKNYDKFAMAILIAVVVFAILIKYREGIFG